jgi:hypothetical protein
MEDSALKNAYVEYQTVIDLFTPPESQWVKMSRERLQEIAEFFSLIDLKPSPNHYFELGSPERFQPHFIGSNKVVPSLA